MRVLITGSCGLIGSEAVLYYHRRAQHVIGIDNNMRRQFFGADGDTAWRRRHLEQNCPNYRHRDLDIRDRQGVASLIAELRPDLVIHCAAQPSHDLAATIPFVDFEVNAVATLNLLEATRQHAPQAVFIFMSTNKVYGDGPNRLPLRELPTRWDYADPAFADGIAETFPIDQSLHSLFGASKLAADVLVQEYGRYFGLRTVCFRGGCLTGTGHSAAQLHGFLSYFFKAAAAGKSYTVIGYQGKQVRDQIHAHDVLEAFDAFYRNPRCGAVYNLGGGRDNSASILECIDRVEQLMGRKMQWTYDPKPRVGDHICYYSDLRRFEADYPGWSLQYSLDRIFEEFAAASRLRRHKGSQSAVRMADNSPVAAGSP